MMGGKEDEELPLKRMKLSSLEAEAESRNRREVSLDILMAKSLPLQEGNAETETETEILGSKGLIKKVEFVRIITQALYSLGYQKAGAILEDESGIPLQSEIVSLFRKQILDGKWDESVLTLHRIGQLEESTLKAASFLILQHKFFELLDKSNIHAALMTLRSEISPLQINTRGVRELSSCVISPSRCELLGYTKHGDSSFNQQMKLLQDIQQLLPPSIMIPEKRLESLIEQALNVQREACVFHNSQDNALSLYTDHQCGKDQIPAITLQADNVDTVESSSILNLNKGFSFSEVSCIRASTSKVICCHFSSDGKLLATAGHDKKAVLWNMDTFELKSSLEGHHFLITDVRFSPNSTRLATSSFDRTVRVWDVDNPNFPLRTFQGHSATVMSLDFHPINEDLICSCDGDSETRYWSVTQGMCTRIFKGGTSQMRFQPRVGRFLAAAAENVVSIFDVETNFCVHSLQRHTKPVHSLCWDQTGNFLASASEDSVSLWAFGSGSDGECVRELFCGGNKFHSCVFHPSYQSVLVIGCDQSLELWNIVENKSMTISAHDGLIAALAVSPATGMVASASHDKCVKLWK